MDEHFMGEHIWVNISWGTHMDEHFMGEHKWMNISWGNTYG